MEGGWQQGQGDHAEKTERRATNEERRTHPERINPMFALLRHLFLPCGQDKFSSWWPLSSSPEASTQVSTTLCFGRTRETLSWKAILQAPPVDISAFTLSLLMNFLMLSITPYVTSAPPLLNIADVYGGPHCVEHVLTSPVGIGKPGSVQDNFVWLRAVPSGQDPTAFTSTVDVPEPSAKRLSPLLLKPFADHRAHLQPTNPVLLRLHRRQRNSPVTCSSFLWYRVWIYLFQKTIFTIFHELGASTCPMKRSWTHFVTM